MAKKRRRISRRASKKLYKKGMRVKTKNIITRPSRGGHRL